MSLKEFHQNIIDYYHSTENSYIDGWDLNNSYAMHYGYWDFKVSSFPESLQRMNEMMMETVQINSNDHVLDSGCGIGGTSIFIAQRTNCKVFGISLSKRQIEKAQQLAKLKAVDTLCTFEVQDFCSTSFPNAHFDVVLACESVCHAYNKKQFIEEAFRVLKPGGRLIIVDGFVNNFENNNHPFIKKWLEGWHVNFLESPQRMKVFLEEFKFDDIQFRDISEFTFHSAKRLNMIYYFASIYLFWKALPFSKKASNLQKKNIKASRYQYLGLKKGLWGHGCLTAKKIK